MAIYSYDLISQSAASPPAGMTPRWNTSATWSVIDNSGYPWYNDGKGIQRGGSGWGLLSWDVIDSDDDRADVEVVVRVNHGGSFTGGRPLVALRASGTDGDQTGYYIDIDTPLGNRQLRIRKIVNGSAVSLANINLPINPLVYQSVDSTYNFIKFRAIGNLISVKFWNPIDPEPESWLASVTDSASPITSAGWVGLTANAGVQYASIDVATDGDEIPLYEPVPTRITQSFVNLIQIREWPVRITQTSLNIVYVPGKPGRLTQSVVSPAFLLDPVLPKALLPVVPVEEMWEWQTTQFKSYSGREQRMALRDQPHMRIRYNLALLKEEDRQTLMYTMHRHIGNQFHFPLFMYTARLLATASVNQQHILLDLEDGNFRAGEAVAVFNDDLSIYHVLQTDDLITGGMTLKLPLEEELPAGLYVAPAPVVRTNEGQSWAMGVFSGTARLDLFVDPPREVVRPGSTASLDFYDAFPILPDRFLNPSGTNESLRYNTETISPVAQAQLSRRRWRFPQLSTTRTYLTDRDGLDYWRQFGNFIKGGRGLFLIPSYRDDFSLMEQPALGTNVLMTRDTYVADYFKSPAWRWLRFVSEAGVYYRKINEALLNMDRTVTIRLADPLPNDVGANVFSMISIMNQVRISDDTITVTHESRHVEVSFPVVTAER